MIVNRKIDFVSLGYEADKINRASHAAYWLHNHLPEASGSFGAQETEITESVTRLAELLGFRLVPVERLPASSTTGEAA